jgi:hypothetical protein
MARPTIIRLAPLGAEHRVPAAAALGVLVCLGAAATAAGGGVLLLVAVLVAAVFYAVEMVWLVALWFDDDAITIVRPWRRQRIAWSQVAGLIYTRVSSGRGPRQYRLRLVLADGAPPPGVHLTDGDQPYGRGPVLFTTRTLELQDANACRSAVYAELERRGFQRPEPFPLRYQPRGYSRAQQTLAVSMDVRKAHHNTHPVTVNHGGGDPRLAGEVLPRLALAHGGSGTTHAEPGYTVFFFEGPGAEAGAAAFRDEARRLVPSAWTITPTALPDPDHRPGDGAGGT